MILYGVVLKCLDPILTIACSLAHGHPFINPSQAFKKQKASESKLKFSAGNRARTCLFLYVPPECTCNVAIVCLKRNRIDLLYE